MAVIDTIRTLLLELPNRCEGSRDEGLLFIESVPGSAGGVQVNVEIRLRTCFQITAEEKLLFLQEGSLLSGLQNPIPNDLDAVLDYLERKLKTPWRLSRHGSIAVKVKTFRDGRKKLIFLEPLNRSFLISPSSIDSLSR